jgi:hypothetical protein
LPIFAALVKHNLQPGPKKALKAKARPIFGKKNP